MDRLNCNVVNILGNFQIFIYFLIRSFITRPRKPISPCFIRTQIVVRRITKFKTKFVILSPHVIPAANGALALLDSRRIPWILGDHLLGIAPTIDSIQRRTGPLPVTFCCCRIEWTVCVKIRSKVASSGRQMITFLGHYFLPLDGNK